VYKARHIRYFVHEENDSHADDDADRDEEKHNESDSEDACDSDDHLFNVADLTNSSYSPEDDDVDNIVDVHRLETFGNSMFVH